MANGKSTRVPHVTQNVSLDDTPAFQYEGCGFNPLRIIVKNELRKLATKQNRLEFTRHRNFNRV